MEPPELQELPIEDAGAEISAATPPPSGFLWLYYLYLRPRTFFRHFVIDPSPALTALCAWMYGMTSVIDYLDTRISAGAFSHLPDSWPAYWGMVALGGVLAGLFYFAIGGWWYRVRLEWSGAEDPDRALARRVYLYASQVLVLPILLATVAETTTYETPAVAAMADSSWYLLLIVFPLWSLWTSYAGVRTAFDVRRGRALCWFLILPCWFYAILFAGLIVALVSGTLTGPADVTHTFTHDSSTMTFSYPGNWWIDDTHEDYDPDGNLFVEPWQDAFVLIVVYESDSDIEDEVQVSRASYEAVMSDAREVGTFSQWGRYHGKGVTLRGIIDGTPGLVRIFAASRGDGWFLEVREWCAMTEESDVQPGFELIRSTFRLKE